MRLGKFLAHAGVASRRAAEGLIADGRVTVGGEVVTNPATDVDERSGVAVDGRPVAPEQREVHALNKPAGVVSTARDTHGRPTVVELVRSRRRLYPVGRLDADSTGLILLTNDGELADLLTHPRYGVEKVYRAKVQPGRVPPGAIDALREGVELEDGVTAPARVRQVAPGVLEITLREGRKRQVGACARRSATGSSRWSAWRSGRSACAGSSAAAAAASRTPRSSACAGPPPSREPAPDTIPRRATASAPGRHHRRGERGRTRSCRPRRSSSARSIGRNDLVPDDIVSCIFTCTGRPRRRVPRGRGAQPGPQHVPLLCAREMQVPGSLPRVIRLLLHCYCDPADRAQPRLPARGCHRCARTSSGRAMTGLEFNRHLEDIPVYPAASTYEFDGELVKLASNETPYEPHPQVLEAVEAQLRTLNRYPDPEKSLLRRRISERTGVPIEPHRDRQRLVRDPAGGRGGDARAGRRGRLRLALVLDLPPAGGRHRRDRGDRSPRTRPASTTSRRWPRRSPPPRAW